MTHLMIRKAVIRFRNLALTNSAVLSKIQPFNKEGPFGILARLLTPCCILEFLEIEFLTFFYRSTSLDFFPYKITAIHTYNNVDLT